MKIDPARMGDASGTGIFVRAQDDTGKWHNADIACLDTDSLVTWLRLRGGYNPWAESVVLTFLQRDDHDLSPQTPIQHLQAGLGIAAAWDLKVTIDLCVRVFTSDGHPANRELVNLGWTRNTANTHFFFHFDQTATRAHHADDDV